MFDHAAMRYKNTKAHDTHCTMCQSSDKSDKSDKSDLSDILCPQYRLCAMRSASQQTTQPCAIKIQKHMALTAPCANRPTSPTSPTCPTFFAHSIGSAPVFAALRRGKQCTLPTSGNELCFLENAKHMEHGGKPYFSPRVPPFRPGVVKRHAARNAALYG